MKKENDNIKSILEKNKYNLDSITNKSRKWFQDEINSLGRKRITANKLLSEDPSKLTNSIAPGFMYMFYYDPKYKNELPYYDRFPLILPFREVPGGFYGLNLHYLPYYNRAMLLDKISEFAVTGKGDRARIKLSWQLLNSSSKLSAVQPCVKHYLYSHVRSQFKLIPMEMWATAAMMPVEKFVGSTKENIWRDSKKIGGFR